MQILIKAFDCTLHNLLVTELDTYGFNRETVAYIYSYVKDRKQCIRMNGTQCCHGVIVLGVPQYTF